MNYGLLKVPWGEGEGGGEDTWTHPPTIQAKIKTPLLPAPPPTLHTPTKQNKVSYFLVEKLSYFQVEVVKSHI